MIYTPKPHQVFTIDRIMKNPYCGAFLDMGLGKTGATLTAVERLLYDEFAVNKVLVIAPKFVAENTWPDEIAKWDHLKHLRYSLVLGDVKKRKAALRAKADIYIINPENIEWLVAQYGTAFPFDMWVIDESSKFKSHKSVRFKQLKIVRPFSKRVVLLSGTPMANSELDLWSQMYLLDKGERLGENITSYRTKHFSYQPYEMKYIPYSPERIFEKIGDICFSMKTSDWQELPEFVEQTVNIRLSSEVMKRYYDFEKEMVLALNDRENITAVSAAGLSNKLRQFANGAVYNEDHVYHEVHTAKLEALEQDLEILNGRPMLLAYSYQSDVDRIMKYLKRFNPRVFKTTADKVDWNNKKIPLMLLHPASGGYGLNLQAGGNQMGCFGVDWNLEYYQQFVKRIHRDGVEGKVFMRKYVVPGTIEDDVLIAQETKDNAQNAMLRAVKARFDKYAR